MRFPRGFSSTPSRLRAVSLGRRPSASHVCKASQMTRRSTRCSTVRESPRLSFCKPAMRWRDAHARRTIHRDPQQPGVGPVAATAVRSISGWPRPSDQEPDPVRHRAVPPDERFQSVSDFASALAPSVRRRAPFLELAPHEDGVWPGGLRIRCQVRSSHRTHPRGGRVAGCPTARAVTCPYLAKSPSHRVA